MKKTILFLLAIIFININFAQKNPKIQNWTISEINSYYDSITNIQKSAQLNTNLFNLRNKKKFNGVILISYQGKIILHKAYGYANLKKKIPLTLNTVFELASVSKQFTAASIMLLKERGLISYSDSVQKFITDFPYRGVTIHNMLCHRSGLPHYYYFAPKYWGKRTDDISNDTLIKMMIEQKPEARFAPNSSYEYCNTAYCILAYIVEKVSGKPYGEFVKDEIFTKAGMKRTFARTHKIGIQKNFIAEGYDKKGRLSKHTFLSGTIGDKGIYSTAYDLYLWDKALREFKILKKETLIEAITGKSTDRKPDANYGYGWHIGTYFWGQPLIFHGGLWNGYNTLFIRRINDNSLIVVLSNVVNFSFSRQSNNWMEIMDGL